jgi:D-glycero-D-manno-heptose 1,7-bisphosphate phosphatase
MAEQNVESSPLRNGRIRQGVFIERDGLLNHATPASNGSVSPLHFGDFKVNESAMPLVKRLKIAGLVVIATTHQPALSDGRLHRADLVRMHELLRRTFDLEDIAVCPHDATQPCFCRHPKPGLLVEAAFHWRLNLDHCFVVSDKWQDAEAAYAVGCTPLLVNSPWIGKDHLHFVGADLSAVVEKLLQLHTAQRLTMQRV